MSDKIAVDMLADDDAGTVVFTVVPADKASLIGAFLATGLDYIEGLAKRESGEADAVSD